MGNKPRRPHLTSKAIDGIIGLYSLFEACPEDFIGSEEENWTDDEKRCADEMEAAGAWARKMRDWMDGQKILNGKDRQ